MDTTSNHSILSSNPASVGHALTGLHLLPKNLCWDAATTATRDGLDDLDDDADGASADANFLLSTLSLSSSDRRRSRPRLRNTSLFKAPQASASSQPHTPPTLHDNKQRLLLTLQRNPFALEFASQELRADFDIAMLAVNTNPFALKYVAPELQSDRQLVLLAVQHNGYVLKFADQQLRADRGLVLIAVASNFKALQFASSECSEDFEIAMKAVSQDYTALEFVGPSLKCHPELLYTAAKNHISLQPEKISEYPFLLESREIVSEMVERSGETLAFVGHRWQDDDGIVLAAIAQNPRALCYAAPRFRDDRSIALTAVKRNAGNIRFLNPELKKDFGIAFVAVTTNACAFQHIHESLRNNADFVKHVFRAAGITSIKIARKRGVNIDSVNAKNPNNFVFFESIFNDMRRGR